jgi:hypothetical protein
MKYTVQFFRGDALYHTKEWDLGLDAAKQHAQGMLKPYGASSSNILDDKRKIVCTFELPADPPAAREAVGDSGGDSLPG